MFTCATGWVGLGFPALDGAGTVHSVFSKAINLRWDTGELLTLATPAAGRAARTLSLSQELDLQSLGVCAGSQAILRHPLLTLGQALCVDLSEAKPWMGLLHPPLPLPDAMDVETLRSFLDQAAPAHSLWQTKQQDPELGRLFQHLLADAAAILPQWIGRGSGLTPSCDDALLGLLAVWTAFPMEEPLQSVQSALPPLLPRTTDVSRQMLENALEGHFPEAVERLLLSLSGPEINGLPLAARTLAAVGSSSGFDMLTGIVAGLKCTHRKEKNL